MAVESAPRPQTLDPTAYVPAAKQAHLNSLAFTGRSGFRHALNTRVDEFIRAEGIRTRDVPAMYAKSAVVFVWWLTSLGLWYLGGIEDWHWLTALAFAASFGLATIGVGFNVMHDSNHGAYSNRPAINRLLSYSGEMIGLSTFIWRQQHNVWHHTYPNIAGLDEALEADGWLRSSPLDVWRPLHRYQHLYAPVVYALAGVGLLLLRNFKVYFTGKSSEYFVYPKMSPRDKVTFWLGRIFNILLYFVIPFLVFPWWLALACFLVFSCTAGLVMAHVLMLAHVSDELAFVEPSGDPLRVEEEWAVHQVAASMNFAPNNPLINWYVGGLNYQIEHHLFPQTCQLVYPRIAPIVEQTCREFGVPYRSNPSFVRGIVEHYKTLRAFGGAPQLTA